MEKRGKGEKIKIVRYQERERVKDRQIEGKPAIEREKMREAVDK